MPATASWIRSASRSRTSTAPGAGASATASRTPSTPPAELPDGTTAEWPGRPAQRAAARTRPVRADADREAHDVRARAAIEYYDMPTVRRVVRAGGRDDYRFVAGARRRDERTFPDEGGPCRGRRREARQTASRAARAARRRAGDSRCSSRRSISPVAPSCRASAPPWRCRCSTR